MVYMHAQRRQRLGVRVAPAVDTHRGTGRDPQPHPAEGVASTPKCVRGPALAAVSTTGQDCSENAQITDMSSLSRGYYLRPYHSGALGSDSGAETAKKSREISKLPQLSYNPWLDPDGFLAQTWAMQTHGTILGIVADNNGPGGGRTYNPNKIEEVSSWHD
jgi:hypothetical protein